VCAVRTEPLGREEWLVGCTFASKISEDEIQTLITQVGMNTMEASGAPELSRPAAEVRTKKLTHKQETAIAALLEDTSVAGAASAASVSERTLRGWLALPAFQQALYRARQRSVDSSMTRLLRLADRAATILETNLTCGQPGVEVQAAGEVLRLALAGSWNASYQP
jgi:hypothetical protein